MRKVIVTGGAGFIGSHLVERLVKEGHRVAVLDNLSTGRLDNLKTVKSAHNFTFIKTNITNSRNISKYFKGVDWVFHLAALADIIPSIVQPYKYHLSNVDGAIAVLEASRKNSIKKFIYAASSSCYGVPKIYPTPESASILPQYPYAFTKYLGECCVFFWQKVYKLPVISLRLFNVYGPRARTSGTYGAVIGVFLAQKLANKPFTIVGDGKQKRDFIFITDAVDAFIKAAASNINNVIFNVGSGKPQNINKLVNLLGGKKIHIPKRPGEPDCTWADITKIKRILNWHPKVSFEQGITKVLQNLDYWKDAPVWTPEKIEKATQYWFRYLSDKN
jgi:UDP-glucose 4-epimerase